MWVDNEVFETLVDVFILPFYDRMSVHLIRKVLKRINVSKHIIIYDSRSISVFAQGRGSDYFPDRSWLY